MGKKYEDHLKDAEMKIMAGGKKIILKRWTVRQYLMFSGSIVKFVRQYFKSGRVEDLLNEDLLSVLPKAWDSIMPIIAETIKDNFKGETDADKLDEAEKFLDGKDAGLDAMNLAAAIFRQNFGGENKKKLTSLIQNMGLNGLLSNLFRSDSVTEKSLTE